MLFTTKVVWDMRTKEEIFHSLIEDSSGRVAYCKKGREQQQQVTDAELAKMKTDTATQNANYAAEQPFIQSEESQKPGTLSPFAQSQLDSDVRNINDTYGGLRKTGLKSIAQRGFGNAPTGMEASVINTNNENQGKNETSAYETALANTLAMNQDAANRRQGLQQIYNPNQSAQVASDSALNQFKQGSTLGDIGAGLSTAAGLATTGAGIHG